jgi:hypothetical protein
MYDGVFTGGVVTWHVKRIGAYRTIYHLHFALDVHLQNFRVPFEISSILSCH